MFEIDTKGYYIFKRLPIDIEGIVEAHRDNIKFSKEVIKLLDKSERQQFKINVYINSIKNLS